MAAAGKKKYGDLKPKKRAERKINYGNNRKDGQLYFITGSDNEAKKILNLLYEGDIDTSNRKKRIRPLYMLWRSAFKLKTYAEPWARDISNFINEKLKKGTKVKVYGGAFKDVIYMNGNAYTFALAKEKGRMELSNLKRIRNTIMQLDEYYRDRINVPVKESDIYYQTFTHVDEEVSIATEFTVIMTKVPWCIGGNLGNYPFSISAVDRRWKKYIQLVYEYCKVLHKLQREEIYHLDIKPDNLFICTSSKNELFSFGDVEGFRTCRTMNCEDTDTGVAATYMYLPYDGASFAKDKYFPHRDVYAMMRTLLATFYNVFNFRRKRDDINRELYRDKRHMLRFRASSVGVSGPGEPLTQEDAIYTEKQLQQLIETIAVDNKRGNEKSKKYYGVNVATFTKNMTKMMYLMVLTMWNIDQMFYGMSTLVRKMATSMTTPKKVEVEYIDPEALLKSLTAIMECATKLGATPKKSKNFFNKLKAQLKF